MTVWRHRDDVAWTPGNDRVVVLDLRRPNEPGPMALEGTAGTIWQSIDGVRTVEQVVAAVAESYGLEAHQVERDVAAFVDELVGRDLLQRVEHASAE